jgi:hypothetical protein
MPQLTFWRYSNLQNKIVILSKVIRSPATFLLRSIAAQGVHAPCRRNVFYLKYACSIPQFIET